MILQNVWSLFHLDFILCVTYLVSTTHPPLPAAHEGQVEVEPPPLAVLVPEVEPVVAAVVGHAQEHACTRILLLTMGNSVFSSPSCICIDNLRKLHMCHF